jgi:hypothetical protein
MKNGIINNHIARSFCLPVIAGFLLLISAGVQSQTQSQSGPVDKHLSIESDHSLASEGYFRLNWSVSDASEAAQPEFIVQQSSDADFQQRRVLYQGGDQSALLSGLADGDYYYRVGLPGQASWSEPVHIEVRHHSLSTATRFFLLGLVVFLLTAGTILFGIKQTR